MTQQVTRRWILGSGAALTALAPLAVRGSSTANHVTPLPARPPTNPEGKTSVNLAFTAQQRPMHLLGPDRPATPLWTFSDEITPIVRIPHGTPLRAELTNELSEHTSIHWHGLRIPHAMDGVPYVSQPPVEPGDRFVYEFTPPDTGTFFFHPHCNTATQLGRGLAGILIVEGDETQTYDADLICALKDWRLDTETGAFLPFTTDKGASGVGTFGTWRTANAERLPVMAVPSGGDIRLRLLNLDVTRTSDIVVEGADAAIIAIDGNPVPPLPLAGAMTSWRLGPAMRLDLVIRAPAQGGEVTIMDYFAAEPHPLARLRAAGPDLNRGAFDPAPLYASRIPVPDLTRAVPLRFTFSAAVGPQDLALPPELALPNGETLRYADALCLSDKTFWTINQQSWPEDGHQALPPPLATLERGKSYLFDLVNTTQHRHPIHIHGHTFLVLSSNQRTLPRHHADTVLVAPKERVRVALVADNPGDWMFHCHIVEHQDTGMMGIIRVT